MSETGIVNVISEGAPFAVTASDGRHQWLSDEQATLGGADAGPSPPLLVLAGLGACTAITLRMYAQRKQWDLQKVEVAVALNSDGASKDGSNRMLRRITLHGSLDAEQRARLLEIANKCPVHKLLSGTIDIESGLTA